MLPGCVVARFVQHKSSVFAAGHEHTNSIDTSIHFITSNANANRVFIASSGDELLTLHERHNYCDDPIWRLFTCMYWMHSQGHGFNMPDCMLHTPHLTQAPPRPHPAPNGITESSTCFAPSASCKHCLCRPGLPWPPPLAPPLVPDLPTTETALLLACSSNQLSSRRLNRSPDNVTDMLLCRGSRLLGCAQGLVVQRLCCWPLRHMVRWKSNDDIRGAALGAGSNYQGNP